MTPRDHDEKPMTGDEALSVVKEAADSLDDPWNKSGYTGEKLEQLKKALATLDRLRAHWSRFKVGDEVWVPSSRYVRGIGPMNIISINFRINGAFIDTPGATFFESDCFPTREEAEAESARRNEAK